MPSKMCRCSNEALNLAQTQLDQDNQRVQIGTLAVLSVQQDESQVAQSKANLIAAQSALDSDQNALKNLLTDNYSQWHDTDIQPVEMLKAHAANVRFAGQLDQGHGRAAGFAAGETERGAAGHPVEI